MRGALRWFWRELTRPRGRTSGSDWFGVARTRKSGGGLALLMVVTTLMFMTVLVTDINYGARVRLMMAANQRDEAAAYWLARTGVHLYQLVLVANKELSKNSMLQTYAATFGLPPGDLLWTMIPTVNTGLLRMFMVSSDVEDEALSDYQSTGQISDEVREESRASSKFGDGNFLDFEGDFSAEVTDEDSKININGLAGTLGGQYETIQDNPYAKQLFALMSGEDNDQWFYDRDIDRWEIIANLKDWMDQDNTRSSVQGGYEDNLYNRLDSPYLTKNAPFDSKEEIRLVEGWQDDLYDKFGPRITIYGGGKININQADDEIIGALIRACNPSFIGDETIAQIIEDMREYMLLTYFQSGKDFANWLNDQGANVEDQCITSTVTTSSTVFTVTSTGLVGDATSTITVVFDFSTSNVGKIVYWRVD